MEVAFKRLNHRVQSTALVSTNRLQLLIWPPIIAKITAILAASSEEDLPIGQILVCSAMPQPIRRDQVGMLVIVPSYYLYSSTQIISWIKIARYIQHFRSGNHTKFHPIDCKGKEDCFKSLTCNISQHERSTGTFSLSTKGSLYNIPCTVLVLHLPILIKAYYNIK